MTLSYDGYDYATVKLLAADSVSVNRFLQGKYLLSQFFSKPLVKILTVVVILLVLAVVVWVRMLAPAIIAADADNRSPRQAPKRLPFFSKRKDIPCPTMI